VEFFFAPHDGSLILTWVPDFKVMERAAGSVWLILAPSKPMADQGKVTGELRARISQTLPPPKYKVRDLQRLKDHELW
jgi:hypothetical protein